MISSFSTKPIPISFYEYKKIMEQKLPKKLFPIFWILDIELDLEATFYAI